MSVSVAIPMSVAITMTIASVVRTPIAVAKVRYRSDMCNWSHGDRSHVSDGSHGCYWSHRCTPAPAFRLVIFISYLKNKYNVLD